MHAKPVHQRRTARILLIEDTLGEAILAEKALRATGIKFSLHIAMSGEEGLDYFDNAKELPDLVLLDLNLPGMYGVEVLMTLKTHPTWRVVPVVVLTSSDQEADIAKSYTNYCNAYLLKSGEPEHFRRVVKSLSDFWFETVSLAEAKIP